MEESTTGLAGFQGHQPIVTVESAAENEVRLRAAGRWKAHMAQKLARKETGGIPIPAELSKAIDDAGGLAKLLNTGFNCPTPECSVGPYYHQHVTSSHSIYTGTPEQAKYEQMWEFPQYRHVAPGEDVAQVFLSIAKPAPHSNVIDFGAGTGRGALSLALFGSLKVQMLDFAANCLDEDVKNATVTQPERIKFAQHDLNREVPFSAEYGFCTDVMEHLPPGEVETVLTNVMRAARHVFFQISCVDDVCGKLIGAPLHLSVHPYAWWLKKLQDLGATVHWSDDKGSYCLFYVTSWLDAKELVAHGVLNVEEDAILNNVSEHLLRNFQEVTPHETNDMEVMLLGGGPSLAANLETIKQLRAEGVKLITLNGTYNWAIEHGLKPSATIIVDARNFNQRFVKPVIEDCKYLISSQAHPAVTDRLPRDRTFIWHTSMDSIKPLVNAKRELWFQIPGGSTVLLRAIPLLRLLGFKKFHLFGLDSCLVDGKHHTYEQAENDSMPVIPVDVGGRQFFCHPWMISQAQEFMDLVKFLGNEIDLEIYGDGLIKHIVTTGAVLADEADFLPVTPQMPDACGDPTI